MPIDHVQCGRNIVWQSGLKWMDLRLKSFGSPTDVQRRSNCREDQTKAGEQQLMAYRFGPLSWNLSTVKNISAFWQVAVSFEFDCWVWLMLYLRFWLTFPCKLVSYAQNRRVSSSWEENNYMHSKHRAIVHTCFPPITLALYSQGLGIHPALGPDHQDYLIAQKII